MEPETFGVPMTVCGGRAMNGGYCEKCGALIDNTAAICGRLVPAPSPPPSAGEDEPPAGAEEWPGEPATYDDLVGPGKRYVTPEDLIAEETRCGELEAALRALLSSADYVDENAERAAAVKHPQYVGRDIRNAARAALARAEKDIEWANREYAGEHDAVEAEITAAGRGVPDVVYSMAKLRGLVEMNLKTVKRRGAERDRLRAENEELRQERDKALHSARQFCGAHIGISFDECPRCWGERQGEKARALMAENEELAARLRGEERDRLRAENEKLREGREEGDD